MAGKFSSYLLLKDKHRLYPRGSIIKLKGKGIYESSSHFFPPLFVPNCSLCQDDVAPLSREEGHLLGAILSPATRYTEYSTPGKLAWGVRLKIGDSVLARMGHLHLIHPSCSQSWSSPWPLSSGVAW